MARLTSNTLRASWHGADRWVSDGGGRGAGRLVARIKRNGVDFYFQYFSAEGRKKFWPLGPYDAEGRKGLALPAARDRVAELSLLYRSGVTDVHEHFDRLRKAEEQARKAAEEAARRELEAAQRSTLKQLLAAYVGHLERQQKESARDVRSLFDRHVYDADPLLTNRKAAELSTEDFVDLIGRLTETGKGRTAAKLRSYLRAAYALAIRSRTDPSAPMALRSFGVTSNPVANIGTLAKYNRVRDRVLSAPELAAFLRQLDKLPAGVLKDALQLGLYLGGQRPTQLLRARRTDLDLSAAVLTLYDPKGARQQPRRHVVPLVPEAAQILSRRINAMADSEFLFGVTGKAPLTPEALSLAVSEMSKAMIRAQEIRDPFQLRDVRRTVETMLAGLGVSSDIRAQLQSHGLGGIQIRHYDRHDYLAEKRHALGKWTRRLKQLRDRETAMVVPLHRPRSATKE